MEVSFLSYWHGQNSNNKACKTAKFTKSLNASIHKMNGLTCVMHGGRECKRGKVVNAMERSCGDSYSDDFYFEPHICSDYVGD